MRRTQPESRRPGELVVYYLKSVFNPSMQRDVYDLLTTKARDAIAYKSFVQLRNGEVSHIVGVPSGADTRVSVSVVDQYTFSDNHCVVYALVCIRYPYSIGEREAYRLVRLHCRKEGQEWAIEPFMHAETGTVIFVPTRMSGPLWRLSRDMGKIAGLVKDEISIYGEEKVSPGRKAMASRPRQPSSETPGRGVGEQGTGGKQPGSSLTGADAAAADRGPEGAAPPAVIGASGVGPAEAPSTKAVAEKKVKALLSIGKLCYEAGRIDAAEDTFRRVLGLDPGNPEAKDYLSRCKNYRLLQKEKEEAVRLMEKLLRLDSEGRSKK